MALSMLKWDLPAAENMEAYQQKAGAVWIPAVLKQPGCIEFRAYRNPYRTTPQILILTEWDSLQSWLNYLESEDYATIMADIRAVGCTNISAEVWGTSPVVPKPLRPPSA